MNSGAVTPAVWMDSAMNFADSVIDKGPPLLVDSLNPKKGYQGVSVALQCKLPERPSTTKVMSLESINADNSSNLRIVWV